METCTLRPPNFDRLSGDAIAGFVQPAHSKISANVDRGATLDPLSPSSLQKRKKGASEMYSSHRPQRLGEIGAPILVRHTQIDEKHKKQQPVNMYDQDSALNQTQFQGANVEDLLVSQKTITVEAYRREYRRKKQIRYRKKQKDYTISLEKGNQELQQEIVELKRRHSSLLTAIPSERIWSAAVKYFQTLQSILQCPAASTVEAPATSFNSPADFGGATNSANVVFNGERGIEGMIQNLKRISNSFDRPHFEVKRCVEDSNNSLEATSTLSLTITEKTLRDVFPQLCINGDRSIEEVGPKLLHQRIAVYNSTRFEWDSTQSCVSSVVTKSDLMKPILNLLGSLENLSRVFEMALVSPVLEWRSNNFSL